MTVFYQTICVRRWIFFTPIQAGTRYWRGRLKSVLEDNPSWCFMSADTRPKPIWYFMSADKSDNKPNWSFMSGDKRIHNPPWCFISADTDDHFMSANKRDHNLLWCFMSVDTSDNIANWCFISADTRNHNPTQRFMSVRNVHVRNSSYSSSICHGVL